MDSQPSLGRPLDDYDDLGNKIDPLAELTAITVTEKPTIIPSTTANPVQQSTLERSTEYKYENVIQTYTIEVLKLKPIPHAAGTLYYTVDPQEDAYKKLMQVYQDNFETPMNRNSPKNAPPPKD
ncbi:uncharacterized protein LOC109419158 [Aedes albopictus]|uniref:Uncharacterized protein n=1 Tax=Aedes albopictus TaxID=7160 RepID=A0ABM1Z4Y0_AEDAL